MDNYEKWPENWFLDKSINYRAAKKIVAGVDIGTTSTQVVLLADGKLFAYASVRTGIDFTAAYENTLAELLSKAELSKEVINKISATGFGKNHVIDADCKFDEIQCHGKGARYMFGSTVETVVDMGGQTVKAIRLYEWDRVRDFFVNDKCATGMGRNIEDLCSLLQIDIESIGNKSLEVEKDPEPVSTTCFSFAQTETMGLFHPGFKDAPLKENEIYASHIFAVAWRILGLIGKLRPLDVGEIDTYGDYCFTGGLAKNAGITKRIERELKKPALTSDIDPMVAGALGAALLAIC